MSDFQATHQLALRHLGQEDALNAEPSRSTSLYYLLGRTNQEPVIYTLSPHRQQLHNRMLRHLRTQTDVPVRQLHCDKPKYPKYQALLLLGQYDALRGTAPVYDNHKYLAGYNDPHKHLPTLTCEYAVTTLFHELDSPAARRQPLKTRYQALLRHRDAPKTLAYLGQRDALSGQPVRFENVFYMNGYLNPNQALPTPPEALLAQFEGLDL